MQGCKFFFLVEGFAAAIAASSGLPKRHFHTPVFRFQVIPYEDLVTTQLKQPRQIERAGFACASYSITQSDALSGPFCQTQNQANDISMFW